MADESAVCREIYKRPTGEVLVCTYLVQKAHSHEHSWAALKLYDNPEPGEEVLTSKRVILALEVGVLDEDLEGVLAAGHNRKEILRTRRSRRRPWSA